MSIDFKHGEDVKGSYIRFVPGPDKPKTKTWTVLAGNHLGVIHWWNAWRKYVFSPNSATLYDPVCLQEIAEFLEKATADHKAKHGDSE